MNKAGAETQTVQLANGLAGQGVRVGLAAFSGVGPLCEELDDRVTFYRESRTGKLDFALVSRIAGIIKDDGYDCVFCTMQFAYLYGWLAKRLLGRKVRLFAAIHTTINLGLKEELQDRLIYSRILKGAERVVFVCEAQKAYWIDKYPFLGERAVVVYNGVDTEHYHSSPDKVLGARHREQFSIPFEACLVVSVAGFRPEKNHEGMIRALARLEEKVHLMLVGEGSLKKRIEDLAAELGVRHRVHFCGLMKDVRPALEAADLMVMPSTAVETFSLAMLEAMSMGVPPLVSNIGGQTEAFTEGNSGWSFPVGDENRFVELLRRHTADRDSLLEAGENARKRVVEHFSKDGMVCNFVKLFFGKKRKRG